MSTITDEMMKDFLARGGKVNVLPMKGVKRATLKPELHKKRDMLADLRARAAEVQS